MASIDPYAVGADAISARARLIARSMIAAITRRAAAAWTASTSAIPAPGTLSAAATATARAAATSLPTTSRPRPRPRSTATTGAAAILRGAAAAPTTSALTSAAAAPNAPPAPRGRPPNNFMPERMPFSQSGIPFLLLNHPLCCIIRRYSRSCPPFCGCVGCLPVPVCGRGSHELPAGEQCPPLQGAF